MTPANTDIGTLSSHSAGATTRSTLEFGIAIEKFCQKRSNEKFFQKINDHYLFNFE